MSWHDRELLEELTSTLIPQLRSKLYDAMRDREAPAPALVQDRPAMLPEPEPHRPRLVKGDESGTPGATQVLDRALRAAGIDLFEFISARDPEQGINVALFRPDALVSRAPLGLTRWPTYTATEGSKKSGSSHHACSTFVPQTSSIAAGFRRLSAIRLSLGDTIPYRRRGLC